MGRLARFVVDVCEAVIDLVGEDDQHVRDPDGVLPFSAASPPAVARAPSLMPLPIVSLDKEFKEYRIKPNETFYVTTRPQCCALRIERLVIPEPEDFVIEDIRVGNRSQLATNGEVPAFLFAPDSATSSIRLDTLQSAMDFTIVATYRGADPEGRVFKATAFGQAVPY